MKEYKVIEFMYGTIYSTERQWPCADSQKREMQEELLNHYAKQGWHLVSTVVCSSEHWYLYLEREI